ncbi:MAG: 5-oxoprolinase subunit B family protein, partial [Alphaproteobacteria bacterium]
MSSSPRIVPLGDSALSIEFHNEISPNTHDAVLALDATLAASPPAGMTETVPTYRALLVHFDPLVTDIAQLSAHISPLLQNNQQAKTDVKNWKIPICYSSALETDLEEYAKLKTRDPADIITEHSSATYRLYMYGFMPGCAYLGGLPPALAIPRRQEPRLKVPANSVMVGGAQGLISTVEMPSGWYVLGRTPSPIWAPTMGEHEYPQPGDTICFEEIDLATFHDMER